MPELTYAQNGEDVVLWRALGHVSQGRYVDVGANHPVQDSVTCLFYEHGWHGVDVEPVHDFASLLRATRPRDAVVEAAAGRAGEITLHEVVGTGLSTAVDEYADLHARAGHQVRDRVVRSIPLAEIADLPQARTTDGQTHFLKVDVEGAEAEVLASADFTRWRPWVVVVEATTPNSSSPTHAAWEALLTTADYRFCLFDGLSRFYLASEHGELAPALSTPAGPQDGFVRFAERRLTDRVAALETRLAEAEGAAAPLHEAILYWRAEAFRRGHVPGIGGASDERVKALEEELAAVRATLSWRITAPLRDVRRLTARGVR